jgi:hypothetical protein
VKANDSSISLSRRKVGDSLSYASADSGCQALAIAETRILSAPRFDAKRNSWQAATWNRHVKPTAEVKLPIAQLSKPANHPADRLFKKQ